MDEIKFANGDIYYCSYLATDGQGTLWIILANLDVVDTVRILSDPNMTSVMEWGGYRLVDYTDLVFVMVDRNGVKCGLKGGHDEKIQ